MRLFGRKAEPEVIDLRAAAEPPRFGLPTPCPECGGPGYLDGVDLKRSVMFQHCPGCSTKWETSEEELLHAARGDAP